MKENYIRGTTLALIVSYLDARQRRKEWQPPLSQQMRETIRKYHFSISPCQRSHLLYPYDHATTRSSTV